MGLEISNKAECCNTLLNRYLCVSCIVKPRKHRYLTFFSQYFVVEILLYSWQIKKLSPYKDVFFYAINERITLFLSFYFRFFVMFVCLYVK